MIVQVEDVEAIKDKTVDKWGRIVGFSDWRGAKVKVLKIKESDISKGEETTSDPSRKKRSSMLER